MDFAAARKTMVESQVRTNDVTDLRIQAAFETIPREKFLPEGLRAQAYVERELPYAPGRRLLTARDFSKLVAAADPRPGDLILDVACGPGYSTAVLAALSEMVLGVEADERLAQGAQDNLNLVGVSNAAVIVGSLEKGAPGQGPFDLVFIGGAIAVEPAHLFVQVKEGGRLAAILRKDGVSRGVVWRCDHGVTAARVAFDATAGAILPGFEAPKTFVF